MIVVLLTLAWSARAAAGVTLTCEDTSAEVTCTSSTKQCRASCVDGSCSTFAAGGEVSICGWLQSLGYDTTELLVTVQQYNIQIVAVTNNQNNNDVIRRSPIAPTNGIYPYTPFSFTKEPASRKVENGGRVEFNCDAEANSSVRYQWYRTQVADFQFTPVLPSKVSGKTSKTYVIGGVSKLDTGYYICAVSEVSTGDVYWSQPAKLEVLYMEDVTEAEYELEVDSGKNIEFISCDLPNSYPAAIAKWYFTADGTTERTPIIDYYDIFYYPLNGRLFILNPNEANHTGTYTCVASNDDFDTEKTIKTVKVSIRGSSAAPSKSPTKAFFDQEAAINVVVGEQLELRCAVYGNPVPTVYWSFGDSSDSTLCKIPENRYQSFDRGRRVVISSVRIQDMDYTYQCRAESSDGDDSKIGTLDNVGQFQELEIKQDKLEYTPAYGGNLTLACPVTGEDSNSWYKNGKALSLSTESGWNKTSNSLEMSATTTSHGVYTCLSLNQYGGLVLKNLHTTIPVRGVTLHLGEDVSNSVEDEGRYFTCVATGFPPPRLYWYENDVMVTDSTRYSFSFDPLNSTVINTTLNVSNLTEQTSVKCLAVSQTENFVSQREQSYTVEPETKKIEKILSTNMLYVIAGVILLALVSFVALCVIGYRFKKERRDTKPIRSYIKTIRAIDGNTKANLEEEYKYVTQLHDILKTMQINDEGGIESFRDIVGDWVNEDLQGGESDFARRFRESFVSKKSMGNPNSRVHSSNRYGNQFKKLNLDGDTQESGLLDETPERTTNIPIGRRSPRRASNPIYAPLPEPSSEEIPMNSLRNSNV